MAGGERLVARSEALAERGPGVRFTIARRGQVLPAFAVRYQGIVRAFVNACAHEGVELDWEEGMFFDAMAHHLVCATHGALYEPSSGRCTGGPCKGRSLEPVEVAERDGRVWLLAGG